MPVTFGFDEERFTYLPRDSIESENTMSTLVFLIFKWIVVSNVVIIRIETSFAAYAALIVF